MVVFRPFKGEVIVARIASQTRDGINRKLNAPRLRSRSFANRMLQLPQISFTISLSHGLSCLKARNCKTVSPFVFSYPG